MSARSIEDLTAASDCDLAATPVNPKMATMRQMNQALDRIGSVEEEVGALGAKMDKILEKLKFEAEKRESINERLGLALFAPNGK